jgi:hypothetical protein
MAATNMDGVAKAYAQQEKRNYFKTFTQAGAGVLMSLFTQAGAPGPGAAPGVLAGIAPVDTTVGSFPFVNAVNPENNYMALFSTIANTTGTLILADRIWSNSGMNVTTTASSWTPTALTRYVDGIGVELWLEQYAALGTSAANLTGAYVDQDGAAGSYTIAKPAVAGVAGTMYPAALAAGDHGVRSVSSGTWSVAQATGPFGLTLLVRLATLQVGQANVGQSIEMMANALTEVADDACLFFMFQCTAATAAQVHGDLRIGKA